MDRRTPSKLFVIAALSATMLLAAAAPALALQGAKVTLDQEAGGVPTRMSFSAITDADAAISSMDFTYPQGFDLSESTFDVTTLQGLARSKMVATGTISGETISVKFAPPVDPGMTLWVTMRDVVTVGEGGTYPLKISYSAETTKTGAIVTETRTDDTVKMVYRSPYWYESSERFLDTQEWVASFNDIKALGMFLKPQLIVRSIPMAFTGWLYALSLVAVGFPLAILLGLMTAFAKMSKIPPVRWIAAAYINVTRGTPLFLQIALVFIGLRIGGLRLDNWPAAVIVLMINSGAYLAEIFRAGIQSISKGQFEAASSLGMTYPQSMLFVIIPQTVKRVLPTMTSEFILLFKDTALFAAFGVAELMFATQNIVARTGNMTPFIVGAVYYLIITIPLINFVGMLERKLALSEHGQAAPDVKPRQGVFWRAMGRSVDPYRAAASDAIHDDSEGR